jgi:hypothetical protein
MKAAMKLNTQISVKVSYCFAGIFFYTEWTYITMGFIKFHCKLSKFHFSSNWFTTILHVGINWL